MFVRLCFYPYAFYVLNDGKNFDYILYPERAVHTKIYGIVSGYLIEANYFYSYFSQTVPRTDDNYVAYSWD
jgi:hypothetical protein